MSEAPRRLVSLVSDDDGPRILLIAGTIGLLGGRGRSARGSEANKVATRYCKGGKPAQRGNSPACLQAKCAPYKQKPTLM